MTVHIFDGMAVMRRRFETELRGPRAVVLEMINMAPSDVALWCFEGRNSLAIRRQIYPPYKVRPSTLTDGMMELIQLARGALRFTRAMQIEVQGREADDVIAHLSRQHGPSNDVVVYTVDKDLKALEGGRVRVDVGDVKHVEPRHIRLYKTLVGDKSDMIPGMKGFGIESFLACNPVRLQAAFEALVAGHARPADFEQAGVKSGMAIRICDPETRELLIKFWQIIDFMPLPDGWEEKSITVGRENFAAADQVLRQFMQ